MSTGTPRIISLDPTDTGHLRDWLTRPNGALPLAEVTFEAVEGGGVWIRTRPTVAQTRLAPAPHADTALCTDPNHVCPPCREKYEAWLGAQPADRADDGLDGGAPVSVPHT